MEKRRVQQSVRITLTLTLGLTAGCAELSYKQIRLGATPGEYERLLPAASTRRTPLGLCHLATTMDGRTETVVLLWTNDRRVAGKIYTRHFLRDWGWMRQSGFLLQGQIDPELYDVAETGPFDTLRALAAELADYRGESLAIDAHAWVVAGLTRLMQRWPGVSEPAVLSDRTSDLYEQVAGGGQSHVWIDRDGIYHFEYRQGQNP
jgi:hypothetical protein